MKNQNSKSKIVSIETVKSSRYNAAADREKNIIGRRIAEARNRQGISLAKFRILLEDYGVYVGVAAIHKWEMGGSAPNAYQLLAVRQALNVELDDYFMSTANPPELNEEGMRKLEDYKQDLIASGRYRPQSQKQNIIQFISMPVSNLKVSAGVGAFLDEGSFEMVDFPVNAVPEGADFGVRVSGDSMEPVYHDGQIVWIQRCEHLEAGQVGVFIYDGEGYLKMYSEQIPDIADMEGFTDSYGSVHMQPVLVSYNQAYSNKPVTAYTEFQIVGRVL